MSKLIIRIFLAAILTICSVFLLACGDSTAKQTAQANSQQVTLTSNSAKKALVVYFSHSGKTQTVAKQIAQHLQADIVRIEAEEPYSQVYRETTQRARQELDTNAYPPIKSIRTNITDYDVILIGYPIWGGRAPRPVMTFLASQDFTGKTVITFCTSGGSPLSGSTSELKAQIPNAKVIEGIRAYPENEKQTLRWLDGLAVLK